MLNRSKFNFTYKTLLHKVAFHPIYSSPLHCCLNQPNHTRKESKLHKISCSAAYDTKCTFTKKKPELKISKSFLANKQ